MKLEQPVTIVLIGILHKVIHVLRYPGSTELWKLGEYLLPLIAKGLTEVKDKFPHPKAPSS